MKSNRRLYLSACLLTLTLYSIPFAPAVPTTLAKTRATRTIPPSTWSLGPIEGSLSDESPINAVLDNLDRYGIPTTGFHFDYVTWETCTNNSQFGFTNALADRLQNRGNRAVYWLVPLVGQSCDEYAYGLNSGFFLRDGEGQVIITTNWEGSGSWIDFDNPAAVTWWHSLLGGALVGSGLFGGIYTDNMGPRDSPLSPAYADQYVQDLIGYVHGVTPDGDVIMKRYGTKTPDDGFLSTQAHTAYVNDLTSDFAGLRVGIQRVLDTAALLPAPFNEFTGYDGYNIPDYETYVRRLHFGAFQAVMEHDPGTPDYPWQSQYQAHPDLLLKYQFYSTLHWELVPYLHSYDQEAYETNAPIFRQPDSAQYSTKLGDEIFVNYVTDYLGNLGSTMPVNIPAGQWVNFWNDSQVFTGPAVVNLPIPLGNEPTLISDGAILPMQVRNATTGHGTSGSAGSLTVNVYPNGFSSFRYYEPTQVWNTFTAQKVGNSLTLCTSATPSQPLIYRIVRWSSAPSTVTTSGGAIGVNESWGAPLPFLPSELAVDVSAGGWFYDTSAQRLYVKTTLLGTGCPTTVAPAKQWLPAIFFGP